MKKIRKGFFLGLAWTALGVIAGHAAAPDLQCRLSGPGHFLAREKARQTVTLENHDATTHSFVVRWQASVPPAILGGGTVKLDARPQTTTTAELRFDVPAVVRPTSMRLEVAVTSGSRTLWSWDVTDRLYPQPLPLSWEFLKQARLGIWDPARTLRARLKELGVSPEILFNLEDAASFAGDVLVIGESALRDPADWAAFHEAFVKRRSRASVVLLRQERLSEKPLGNPGTAYMADICAPGHPLWRGIDPADLAGWRNGGVVGRRPWIRLPAGNFRRLLLPVEQGQSYPSPNPDALLLEEPLENGRVILSCQMPLTESWAREPACAIVFNALTRYALAGGKPLRRQGALFCGDPESGLLTRAAQSLSDRPSGNPVENNETSPSLIRPQWPGGNPGCVIVDGGAEALKALLDGRQGEQVKQYLLAGGILMILSPAPESMDLLRQAFATGEGGAKEAQEFVPPGPEDPLWGITSYDLGGTWSILSRPGPGKGRVVLLKVPANGLRPEQLRLFLSQLLTNLGVAIAPTE